MLHCTIFCSTDISRESSRRLSAIGASRYQQPLSMASLCQHSPLHSLTSIVIVPLGCQRTSYKHNAISSARTLTSASISQAFFTPNGSSRIRNQRKNRGNRKHPNPITLESNVAVDFWATRRAGVSHVSAALRKRSGYRISENRATRSRRVVRVGAA
jgi:hypothetical protein